MSPVTTRPEGCEPPRMSCMKKVNRGCCGSTGATVVLAEATELAPPDDVATGVATGAAVPLAEVTEPTPPGDVVAGVATGATVVVIGPGNGMEGSAMGSTSATGAVASVVGIWPVGEVVSGPTGGATSGISVSDGSDVSVGLTGSGDCGSASSRIRVEVAHSRVMASSKR